MATKPSVSTLSASSVDILNAIRNTATASYRDYVPYATADSDSVKEIGAIIMDFPALQNEFLNALVNRIGRVLVSSKMYSNPWAMFKRGMMEFGETIEEVFVNLAKPFTFDPSVAETNVFKREIPDVRAAFHVMNYQKYYKSTISQQQLRQAFLSWEGVADLITKITEAMYASASYDEFLVMKYMLGKHIVNGNLYAVQTDTIAPESLPSVVSTIKGISNKLEFMSTKYNISGVANYTSKNDQYIIVNSKFDAQMDVEVLASAFNMSKADFMGHRVLVDSFGEIDNERLAELFDGDSTYTPLTEEQLEALDQVPCVLVDKDWFMILDNLQEFTEQFNGEGMYWNYWLHVWKTFSISPFANAVMFIPEDVEIDGVTVSPASLTMDAGQSVSLTAYVDATPFAPTSVTWKTDSDNAYVDANGVVTLNSLANGTIIVTATSTYDTTKSGTCTITVNPIQPYSETSSTSSKK